MDYSFCGGNWNCWYAWLWSSATAAWIQAIVAGLAIWYAGSRSRKTMEDAVHLYEQKIHMDHLESIARFKSALSMARTDLETLVGIVEKEGKIHALYLKAVRQGLIQTQRVLDTLVFKDLPSTQIVRDVLAVSRAVQATTEMLKAIIENPEIAKLDGFIEVYKDIKDYAPKLQQFHELFGKDRALSWSDVFPDHTGFGHGRPTTYREYVRQTSDS